MSLNEPNGVTVSATQEGISIQCADDTDDTDQVINLILEAINNFDDFQQIIWGDGCRKIYLKTPQYPFEQRVLLLAIDGATKEQISRLAGYFWAKLYRQNLSPKLISDGTIYIGDGGF